MYLVSSTPTFLVLSYFEDFEAARIGLTSHFASDILSL